MAKPKILIQLDADAHASVFDAVVAVDAGIDHLFQYHSVTPEKIRDLVYGAMFTRGGPDLASTALFIGGSNVAAGEQLLRKAVGCFFGPMRVSVMLDANGANTTAAAAVLAASKHLDLSQIQAAVLAGTGPVGQRAVRLLARAGAQVRLISRSLEKAAAAAESIAPSTEEVAARITPLAATTAEETLDAVAHCELVIAAGAAGVELLSASVRSRCPALQVAIDLNAVPPLGIAGVESHDKGTARDGVIGYGALGVGGTKMKIHRAAIQRLFQSNDQVLDAEQIYAIGRELG
ncbi:MAG: Bifunctional protein MdtA [Planctomycetota bacterium]|jgi:methylenetetrahydrofolate/methylenetetrahydromethanopterin dehydrogenase (NADP+)